MDSLQQTDCFKAPGTRTSLWEFTDLSLRTCAHTRQAVNLGKQRSPGRDGREGPLLLKLEAHISSLTFLISAPLF